jgi:hypothetical protein
MIKRIPITIKMGTKLMGFAAMDEKFNEQMYRRHFK